MTPTAISEPRTPRAADRGADPGLLASDLRLVVGRLARRLRQRGETGVSASLLSAMWTIERLEPVTLGDLASFERVQPPTVTRVVAKLEEQGLAIREGHESDRRSFRIRLTPQGRRLLDRTRTRRTAYLARGLKDVSEADRETLRKAVRILERVLEGDGPR